VRLVVHAPIETRGLAGGDSRAFAQRVRDIVASAAETDLHKHPPDTVAA